ncbi:MAG: dihydrofolate reductase family protein [Patescibacteria group bacterium]
MDNLQKPETTLIVASSVDGCLVGRDSDDLDSNKSWKHSKNIRGVIQQFFDFSPHTSDVFNLVSVATVIRIGIENTTFVPKKEDVRLIVLDEDNKLSLKGIKNLALSVTKLIIVTTEKNKFSSKSYPSNCHFLRYKKKIDINHLAEMLWKKYKVKKLTIQSSGLFNSRWIEFGLVDFLTVVFYPLLVSNNGTPMLIKSDLFTARPLNLISIKTFDTNYLLLRYKVIN